MTKLLLAFTLGGTYALTLQMLFSLSQAWANGEPGLHPGICLLAACLLTSGSLALLYLLAPRPRG